MLHLINVSEFALSNRSQILHLHKRFSSSTTCTVLYLTAKLNLDFVEGKNDRRRRTLRCQFNACLGSNLEKERRKMSLESVISILLKDFPFRDSVRKLRLLIDPPLLRIPPTSRHEQN